MRALLDEPDPERAWQLFLDGCLPTIERVARSVTGEGEAARDVSAEVLRRMKSDWPALLRRYQHSRTRAQAGFRVWLAVVARNLAIDVLRAQHGRTVMPRPVARMPEWKQCLWKLVFVEECALADAGAELAAERLWTGDLSALAVAVDEIEAALPGSPRARPRPRPRAVGRGGSNGDGRDLEPESRPAEAPDAMAARRLAHEALREILGEFDSEERFLVRTYFLEDKTASQVARVTGLVGANQVYEKIRGLMQRLRRAAERSDLGTEDLAALADFDWQAVLAASDGKGRP